MLKSISFKKLAVLSAGIAIVLSSCGLQNDASDSSDGATAAGKTKNFALSNGYCYDNMDQWAETNNSLWVEAVALEGGEFKHTPQQNAIMSPSNPHINPDGTYDPNFSGWEAFWAGLDDGVPCPVGTTFAESNDVPAVAVKACYTQEFVDATVAGFTEQRDKPDASDAYKAEMQKGIDAISGGCVKS